MLKRRRKWEDLSQAEQADWYEKAELLRKKGYIHTQAQADELALKAFAHYEKKRVPIEDTDPYFQEEEPTLEPEETEKGHRTQLLSSGRGDLSDTFEIE